jgi:3-dehydroquinate synthase
MILETLNVSLGDRSYPIRIGRDMAAEIAGQVASDLSEGRKVAVITDENVHAGQAELLKAAFGDLPVLVLPAGESTKAFNNLERCCDFLAEAGLDRSGRVFAVGGGVIGDLAGFAAASFFRGIGFYQVPTTVLAMVDSSVGGKTGINLTCGKNLVGAFHQPLAVYSDLDTLKEVIKHGMLADAQLFADLENSERLTAESGSLPDIIKRNCAIKAGVVSADEKEQASSGGRALLNLGHTFGHAIEAVAGYGTYLHGEAISMGLVLAARLSVKLGKVDVETVQRTMALVEKYDLPVNLTEPLSVDDLISVSKKDKKARAGKMRYVALEDLGKAVTVEDIPEAAVREIFEFLLG